MNCKNRKSLGARFGFDGIPPEWIKTVKSAGINMLSKFDKRNSMMAHEISFLGLHDADELVEYLHTMGEKHFMYL